MLSLELIRISKAQLSQEFYPMLVNCEVSLVWLVENNTILNLCEYQASFSLIFLNGSLCSLGKFSPHTSAS